MTKHKDITNKKFGKLAAVSFSHIENKRTYWVFRCNCSKITSPRRIDGINKNSSCGIGLCNGKIKNIVGKRFGKLEVLKFSHSNKEYTYWVCRCKCGTITDPKSSESLKTGMVKTCGSGLCNGKIDNLVGSLFGKLEVLKFSHSQRFDSGISVAYWICKCGCGDITKPIQATHLKSGNIKGCGCCRLSSESDLVNIIESLFSDKNHCVKRHYTVSWLGCQHVDGAMFYKDKIIFGFEYDGEQHFKPIKHWGGHKKLSYQRKLDRKKDNAFKEAGIPLLRVSYKDKDRRGKICKQTIINKLTKMEIKITDR